MLIYYFINCALLPSWEQKHPFFARGLKLCKTLDLTIPDDIQTSDWRYCYQILDVRKYDSEDFLNSANPDALVLAILCDFKGRDPRALVAEITSKLRRLHGDQLDGLRESLVMLDILATNRDLQYLVKENSAMFIEVEKLGIYQLAMERGEQKGLQKAVTALAQRGFSLAEIAHDLELTESEVRRMLG